ncbi:MAG: translation initiation factor IF-3 [Parcubacteria group bacterium Gr01-1014_20]|nr:MAG: translation initiation factor IF-3 [Parcubacteria group bacterium Gr01-1014_20]
MRINPRIQKPRLNHEITASEVRLIDEKGEALGVMKLGSALKIADQKGLDLIEVVATATPPVVKVMSYDKYRYQKEKTEKKERIAQKTAEIKQIQISARAQKNDLLIKVHQLEKFMNEGHPIEIALRLRGREKYNREWANQKLAEFLKMITIEHKVLGAPKFGGYGLNLQIAKK